MNKETDRERIGTERVRYGLSSEKDRDKINWNGDAIANT